MSQQKSLNLDQSKIEAAAQEFAQQNGATLTGPRPKGKAEEYELRVEGSKPALLHVFKRNDGTTTLHSGVGQNQELSKAFADHIAKSCSREAAENRPLVLAKLQEDTWQFLLDYLKSESCKVSEEPQQHGKRFKVIGPQQDQVVLYRYDSGKFMMQGKAMGVYAMVASALCELHEDKREVLEAQLQTVPVTTTIDGLYAELHEHLPSAAGFLGDTGCAILAPAIALTKVEIPLSDYSVVAFPALRGLEYYMKALLVRNNLTVKAAEGLGAYFTTQGAVKSGCTLNCKPTIGALETSYELHGKHRNALFHADGAAPVMTRILEDKQQATDIVFEVLRTIEMTYAAIPVQQ